MLQLGKQVIVLDGGMGSELEKEGLSGLPEELNLTHADKIKSIHRAYSHADIVTTNTFGLNAIKYRGKYSLKELSRAAIENARAAGKKVFFDIGPTGAMLKPLGTLSFDEAYKTFAEIVEMTEPLVDGYILETFSDLYEMKACLVAVRERTKKPVFATMTFDGTGRTLTGSTPEIVANTLEGLGADALGVNCSLGPKELIPVVERLIAVSGVPVIVQPNRGLPVLENGKTVYKLTADEFEGYAKKMLDMGVSVIGGCCGTTPEFIARLAKFSDKPVCRPAVEKRTVVNSATALVSFDGVKICGERLNPTGKRALKEALVNQDYEYLIDEAERQQSARAHLLDLNVGVPQLNEPAVMAEAVKRIQEYVDLPLQIDSSDPAAIEAGARYYNGIPLINSVNGEEAVMARIFPIAKKYGAVVLGLTMDEHGVPPTAEGRLKIAKRILARAKEYGIPRHKIMIDALVVTASAEQAAAGETLKCLPLVKALGVKTALGVSNISFGLPSRALLNRTYLAMALACGLDMPILNPLDGEMTGTVKAHAVLIGADENAEAYIAAYGNQPAVPQQTAKEGGTTLYDCIVRGLKTRAAELCKEALLTRSPMEIVEGVLVKALAEVGELYESGKIFLPQLVSSAEAAKAAFAVIGKALPAGQKTKGTVVLCTVKGDVHDIGKNIVKVVLESYGYAVVDLGKDVPAERVVAACKELKPVAVGLSALMTTTVKSMAETVALLRKSKVNVPVFAGGAVLSEEVAREIGADHYTKDALAFAKRLDELNKS